MRRPLLGRGGEEVGKRIWQAARGDGVIPGLK